MHLNINKINFPFVIKGNSSLFHFREINILPIRGMCSAFDGIFLYNRSNKTKNDVKIFIPDYRNK